MQGMVSKLKQFLMYMGFNYVSSNLWRLDGHANIEGRFGKKNGEYYIKFYRYNYLADTELKTEITTFWFGKTIEEIDVTKESVMEFLTNWL